MGDIEIKQEQLPSPDQMYNRGKEEILDLRELIVGQGSTIFYTDKEGSRWGNINFDDATAYIKIDGSAKFKTAAGDVLISTDATDGNFINVINTALNTASKTILTDFTFQATDYAGAFKAGNPTWDETTGLITGGSGVLINARGILGANAGVATFTLDATTGNATFAGTLVAAAGTLGTITAGTITGATISTTTPGAATGAAVVITGGTGQFIKFYYNTTQSGFIQSFQHTSGEDEYLKIQVASGRLMSFRESQIAVNGDFVSTQDNADTCGSSTKRWSDIRSVLGTISGLLVVGTVQGDHKSSDGTSGINISFGYTDDNGNDRFLQFKDGLLIDQHS